MTENTKQIVLSSNRKNTPSNPALKRFPQKLWDLVNSCQTGAIGWSPDGESILINYTLFQKYHLDNDRQLFKSQNMNSFIRQLNLYGFHKISKKRQPIDFKDKFHQFSHRYFLFGREELVQKINRRHGVKNGSSRSLKFWRSLGKYVAVKNEEKMQQPVDQNIPELNDSGVYEQIYTESESEEIREKVTNIQQNNPNADNSENVVKVDDVINVVDDVIDDDDVEIIDDDISDAKTSSVYDEGSSDKILDDHCYHYQKPSYMKDNLEKSSVVTSEKSEENLETEEDEVQIISEKESTRCSSPLRLNPKLVELGEYFEDEILQLIWYASRSKKHQ